MKKVFIYGRNGSYKIDTLDGIHVKRRTMIDVVMECYKLQEDHDVFIFDIEEDFYNIMCEEFPINKNFWVHVYSVLSMDEIEKMKEERLTIDEFWALYK